MQPGLLLTDRFELERRIGTGGMGEVFRARDRATGESVAIKLLADARGTRSARFEREIALLSELSHPGVVRYVAHGATTGGKLFLVMEWLEGEDLGKRLARGPLTVGESVQLATRVAEALGAAHARGIVHRDLKPSNLFLPDGRIDQVKVLDFGVALREGGEQLTQTGVLIGTPEYMAPEQARNQGDVDARADVFALGCVLFQCLTGTPVFEGDNAASILGQILFGEIPRVSTLWPGVPEDLDALVAQMLSKDPVLRPSDGANLAAALAALGSRVHSAAIAPRGRAATAATASTGAERRFLSVVLVGRAAADAAQGGGAVNAPVDAPLEAAMWRAIASYGGRMEQLADGSMIVVLEAEQQVATDQAAQAARCALALCAVVGDRPMAIAMGRIAPVRKLSGGEVIDRASRLVAELAKQPDESAIALDEVTAGLLDARFDVVEREVGHLLRGERALMQGARTLLGRPTSMVGRDWELNVLIGLLDECVDERKAWAVVVTAAAGMGKSRLAAEIVGRVQRRGDEVAIWIGRGDSLRAGSTLDLLAQALRGALGISGGEPLPERWDRITARVAERVVAGERQRVAEFLGELVGAPFPDDDQRSAQLRAARRDAELMSEQIRRAWLDFLQAETSARPVLLVLEDLHWSDLGTVRSIDAALREQSKQPWMVLALARPEVFDVFPKLWAERQNMQEIRLKELGRKASERLVRQVLGDRVSSSTIERLVQQADGNAFYLEELIRAVAEGKGGALPETVLAMVETRLARLPAEARQVLRAASVFGEVCWDGGVRALLSEAMEPAQVGEWLARLEEQELLTKRPQSRFPGERELAFRHALLREGAYVMLTEDDLRLEHRLAGEWLAARGEGDPMALAGHFERGGEGARAAGYYLRAAEQALYVLDVDATLARADLGLGCAPPEELRLALLGVRCDAASQSMHLLVAGLPAAEELMRAARPGSVPWTQTLGVYLQGTMVAGRIGDLLAVIQQLREVELTPEAADRMRLPLFIAIGILDLLGRVEEGTELEARYFKLVRPTRDRSPVARLGWNLMLSFRASFAHEDPWLGLVRGEENEAIYEVIGGEHNLLLARLFLGANRFFLGANASAEEMLRGLAAADTSLGMGSSLRRVLLALLLAERGALDEAREIASQLAERGRANGFPLEEGRGRWALAEALRLAGDLDGAEREIGPALAMMVPLELLGALATQAAIRLAQGRAGDALAVAEDGLARWRAAGGCGFFRGGLLRLVHAEALHATGAHGAARVAIGEAKARVLAIADRIGDPAYRRSFLEDVPEVARTLALARAWLGDPTPDDSR